MSRCSCGNSKIKHWHLACVDCWNLVPTDLQFRVYNLYKHACGSTEHHEAVAECYRVIHAKRKEAA